MPNAISPLIQQYTVDFASNNNFLFVKGIQGDGYGTRYVDISLMNNGQPYTVSEAVTVVIRGTKPDNAMIFNECEILDNNTIRVEITQQMSAAAGRGNYEISIMSNFENRTLTSFPFFIIISKSSFDIGYVVSSNEFGLLVEKINQVHKIQTDLSGLKSEMENVTQNCTTATDDCIKATNEANKVIGDMNSLNDAVTEAETNRENAEAIRNNAESNRNVKENDRNNAEQIRNSNENQRILNENERKQNENDRKNAELQRQNTFTSTINDVITATNNANSAADTANVATVNTNKAAERANNISSDLENKIATGYFNGKDGKDGIDGKDGVVTTIKGQIAFEIEKGNLMLYYADADNPPNAHIDGNGCLILTLD